MYLRKRNLKENFITHYNNIKKSILKKGDLITCELYVENEKKNEITCEVLKDFSIEKEKSEVSYIDEYSIEEVNLYYDLVFRTKKLKETDLKISKNNKTITFHSIILCM